MERGRKSGREGESKEETKVAQTNKPISVNRRNFTQYLENTPIWNEKRYSQILAHRNALTIIMTTTNVFWALVYRK